MSSVNIEKLKEIVGENNVLHNRADLYVYGSDSSVHEAMPDAIVRPENIEQVQGLMRYANSEKECAGKSSRSRAVSFWI